MNTLHWLPIRERINFKICMYVFKCIHGNAPMYLSDFISHRLRPVTGPITRSSNDSTFIVAHVGRNCIGDKSFYVTAPRPGGKITDCVQKDVKSLTFIQNTDLLCVFLLCFPPLRFDLDGKVRYKCLYVRMSRMPSIKGNPQNIPYRPSFFIFIFYFPQTILEKKEYVSWQGSRESMPH